MSLNHRGTVCMPGLVVDSRRKVIHQAIGIPHKVPSAKLDSRVHIGMHGFYDRIDGAESSERDIGTRHR